MMKTRVAKIIRIASAPPIMVSLLFIILYITEPESFDNIGNLIIPIALLGFVPALAYPLQNVVPLYKGKGREGQRKLAFIMTIVGYTAALLWGIIYNVGNRLKFAIFTYFLSLLILVIMNKSLHFRASGHACSFANPMLILSYCHDWRDLIPCAFAALLICWSSVYLERHTGKELVGGFVASLISYGFALALTIIR